jgi:membrane protease YdiL (CAAX protease family)
VGDVDHHARRGVRRRPVVNARRCFLQALGVLVLFTLARGVGLTGPSVVGIAVLTAVLVLIAWTAGASLNDLGLDPARAGAGLRWGGAACGVVLVALFVAAAVPATRGVLHDSRAQIDGSRLIHELVFTTLLETAIPEEFGFRGVLLGSAVTLWGPRRGALVTSVLFGLWHVQPTLDTMSDNPTVSGASASATGALLVVLGAVVVTFVGGLVFAWLRLRARSLVAPVLAHVATNGLALAVAWLTLHWSVLR